jgi:phosphonate transport system ATP-binding protein
VAVVIRTFAKADVDQAADALAAVGLADHTHQRADTLSGGQQQRVTIARALAQESRILLADEPVASLDPGTAVSILSRMREISHARRMAIVCTLHQRHLAQSFVDRVLEMNAGRLGTVPL